MSNRTPFSHDDVEQILAVVDRLNDVEVTLETGDLKLHVRKGAVAAAVPAAAPAPRPTAAPGPAVAAPSGPAAPRGAKALPEGAVAIRAPMLGTFYLAQSPTEPPFVQVGQRVNAGDPVGQIEVMKLFSTVNASVAGVVVDIPAENGTMVEYDQVLVVVQPGL